MSSRALCWLIHVLPALAGCGPRVLFEAQRPECACTVAVIEDSSGQYVRFSGRDHKPYAGIGATAIATSPDGRRIAYPARMENGWVAVIDGIESPPYDGIAEMVWSPDGRHIAYAAEQRGHWRVVRDGNPGPSYRSLRARSLRFSPDGAHLAYVAQDGGGVVVVRDGRHSAPYDSIGRLVFAAEGDMAFAARRGAAVFVVSRAVESSPYEDIAEIAASPGGRRIAWTARTAEGWRVIEQGNIGEPFDRISPLVFSPRGERLAYAAKRGSGEFVVDQGALSPPYEAVMPQSLVFGADGTSIAFAVRRERKWHIVAGGVQQAPFDEVEVPVFVGSSPMVTYLARTGDGTVLVAGDKPFPAPAGATGLVLAPDGSRYAFAAPGGGNKTLLVHGRVEGAPACEPECRPGRSTSSPVEMLLQDSIVFSPDSAHMGFVAGDTAAKSLFFFADGSRARRIAIDELFMLGIETAGPFEAGRPSIREFVRAEMARWLRKRSPTPRKRP